MPVYAFAAFLIAHGLVHVSLNAVPYGADTPFWPSFWRAEAGRSALLSAAGLGEPGIRAVGAAVMLAATVGFVLAGLALLGLGLPRTWYPSLAVGSSVVSLAMFALFWHPWLAVGALLNVAVLAAVWIGWPTASAGA